VHAAECGGGHKPRVMAVTKSRFLGRRASICRATRCRRTSLTGSAGFPLPAYLNWNAGVTLTRKMFNLDLRYYDTNLSKEDCFVFTGDPNATPGGSIDPVRNPEGLRSRWCSATVVAKFWFALE